MEKIDVTINDTGTSDEYVLQDRSHEICDQVMDCDLRFPTFLVKELLPHLAAQPRILDISSVVARMAQQWVYSKRLDLVLRAKLIESALLTCEIRRKHRMI